MKRIQNERTRLLNKSDLLKEVPCGNQFPTCKFIEDAHKSLELVQIVESKNGDVALRINAIGEELGELEPDKVESTLKDITRFFKRRQTLSLESPRQNFNLKIVRATL